MAGDTVVVSPHFDDAVLSCWHLLTGGADVTVVNVFAGVPGHGAMTGSWDCLTRASDSSARMGERLAEDADALALAGVASVNLDLLDSQYRGFGPPPALAEALAEPLHGAETVYAPAAPYPVPDHVVVMAAALALRPDARLYADLPHAAIYGLPEWVTGQPEKDLDVGAFWRCRLAESGFAPTTTQSHVHRLDDAALERKLEAVRCYRTQVAAVACEAPLDRLRWEVTWTRS